MTFEQYVLFILITQFPGKKTFGCDLNVFQTARLIRTPRDDITDLTMGGFTLAHVLSLRLDARGELMDSSHLHLRVRIYE